MELTRLIEPPSSPLAIVDGEVRSCVQMAKIRAFCKSFIDQCPRDPLLEEGSLNCFVALLRQLFIHLNNRKLELCPEEREIVVKEIHEALDYFSIQTSNSDSPEFSSKCSIDFCKQLFHTLVRGYGELERNYITFLPMLTHLDPSLRAFFYTALYYDVKSEESKHEIAILVLGEISALSRYEPIHRTLNRLWLSVPISIITDMSAFINSSVAPLGVKFAEVFQKFYSRDGKTFAQKGILQEVCDVGVYRVETLIATSQQYAEYLNCFVESRVMSKAMPTDFASITQDKPDYPTNAAIFNLINSTFRRTTDNTIVPEGLEERLEKDEEFCVVSALVSATVIKKFITDEPPYEYRGPSIFEAVYVLDLYMLHCDPRKVDEPTFLRIIGHPNFANVKSKSDLRRLAITADTLGFGGEKRAMVARVFKNANKPIMELAAICCMQPPESESVLAVIAKKALVKEFFPEHTMTTPYNGNLATIAFAYEEFMKLLENPWCSEEILTMLIKNLHVWFLETLTMAAKDTENPSSLSSILVLMETRLKAPLMEKGFKQNYIIAIMEILKSLKGRPLEIFRKSENLSQRCLKTLRLEKNQLRVLVLDMLKIRIEATAVAEEESEQQRIVEEVVLYSAALRELSKDQVVPDEGLTLPALLQRAKVRSDKQTEPTVLQLEEALAVSKKRLETVHEKQVMAEQRSLLFQQECDKSAVENKRLTDEIARIKAKMETLTTRLRGAATTIESQKGTLRKVETESSKKVRRLEKQIEDLRRLLAEEQEALTQQISQLQAKITKLESQKAKAKELPEECVEELLTSIEMTLPKEPVILDPAWCKRHDIQGITKLCERETIITFLRDHKQIPEEEIRKGIIPLPFLTSTLQAIEGTVPEKVYFHTPLGAIPVINSLDRIINLTGPLIDKIARLPLSNGEQWRYDDIVARLSLEQQVDLRRLLRQPIPANLLGAAAIDRVIADLRAIAESGIKLCLLAAVKKGHHPLMENPPERGSILRDSHRIVTLMRIAAREFNVTREFKDDIDRLDRAGMEYYKREYPVRDESAPELLAVMHNITKRLAESPSEDEIAALATSFSQDVMPAMIHLLETVTKLMGRA